jgi:prepilin-type processing-associated H-X9-DG protein
VRNGLPASNRRPAPAAVAPPDFTVPPPPPGAGRRGARIFLVIVLAGIAVLVLACAGVVMAVMPLLTRARGEAERDSCARHLSAIRVALEMYADENRGFYPALSSEPGSLMVEPEALYPGYIDARSVFICPVQHPENAATPDSIDDRSYAYLSHALASELDVLAFAEAYRRQVEKGLPLEQEVSTQAPDGSPVTLRQLRRGVERLLARDPLDPQEVNRLRATIPVVIEWPGHHAEPGGNVLFLDGHVAFMPYPGRFPMTPEVIETLRDLSDYHTLTGEGDASNE